MSRTGPESCTVSYSQVGTCSALAYQSGDTYASYPCTTTSHVPPFSAIAPSGFARATWNSSFGTLPSCSITRNGRCAATGRPASHAITVPKPRAAAKARLAAGCTLKAGWTYMAGLRLEPPETSISAGFSRGMPRSQLRRHGVDQVRSNANTARKDGGGGGWIWSRSDPLAALYRLTHRHVKFCCVS